MIGGLLRFGAPDLNERIAYLPLPVAQTWLDAENRATSLVLGLENARLMSKVERALEHQLPGTYETLNWAEMMPEISQHIEADTAGTYITLGLVFADIVRDFLYPAHDAGRAPARVRYVAGVGYASPFGCPCGLF